MKLAARINKNNNLVINIESLYEESDIDLFNDKNTFLVLLNDDQYVNIGDTWIEGFVFKTPSPNPEWIWNEILCIWEAPKPYPADGSFYAWEDGDWKKIADKPSQTEVI